MYITEPCEPRGWGNRIGDSCTVGGGGGQVLTLALILESALSLKRVFWDLNGVGVVKEG